MGANLLSSHQRLAFKHVIFANTIPSSNMRINKTLAFKKIVCAKQEDNDDGKGTSVDENMVVLRMRIKKMEGSEITSSKAGNDDQLSSLDKNLKEYLEKKTVKNYQESVFETMGNLWSCLPKTRASVTLVLLALAAMTVPLSSSAAIENVLKLVKGLLAGCHVSIDIEF